MYFAKIIASGVVAFGVALVAFSGSMAHSIRKSKTYETASGVLLQIERRSGSTGGTGGGSRRSHQIHVRYSYKVDGQTFLNDRLSPAGYVAIPSEQLADEIFLSLKNASPLKVYYDPGEPNESVAVIEPVRGPLVFFVGGLIFIVLGVLLLCFESLCRIARKG